MIPTLIDFVMSLPLAAGVVFVALALDAIFGFID